MEPAEFVARYIDAWNQHDAQAIANTLSATGKYMDLPVHTEMSREELIVHLEEVFQEEIWHYELVGEVCSGGDTVAFQYKAYPRDGSGDDDSWYGAEFITLRSGTAEEIVDHYQQHEHENPVTPLAGVATSSGDSSVQRYAKSGLGNAAMEELKQKLHELMDGDRLYLEPNLTLPELAARLGSSVNHLSQVINAGFGMSFFDYLNKYRVEEDMRVLGDESDKDRTVLSVALQVGFNSTSTFYVAFKKVTGRTPAQYRRELAADKDD